MRVPRYHRIAEVLRDRIRDGELKAGQFGGRAEHTRQLRCEQAQIRRLGAGLDAVLVCTRRIEQCLDQSLLSQHCSMYDFEMLALLVRQRFTTRTEYRLQRRQHERERSSELVTDVVQYYPTAQQTTSLMHA